MNINRHNYETFFLLYVDNELSVTDRKSVEEFVQVNSDLAPELQLLIDTTLPGEQITYGSPKQLYKNEIELDGLQESLLLHLDNELDAVSTKEIETNIASDNNLKKEWQLWKQTKLDAREQIIFADKKLLYRHEGSRVISMRFWRVAVAAAILLLGLFTGISVLRKDKATDNISTAKNETKNSSNKIQTTGTNKDEIKPSNISVDPSEKIGSENTASIKSAQAQKEITTSPTTVITKEQALAEKNNIAIQQSTNNNKPVIEKTGLENINNKESNKTNTATVLTNRTNEVVSPESAANEMAVKPIMKDKITAPTNPVVDYNSIPSMPDSYAKTAVSNDGSAENNNKILYMNEETVTHSKVGGLFRKVKRVIERNTNIKTGNGVKIAGFEIALK